MTRKTLVFRTVAAATLGCAAIGQLGRFSIVADMGNTLLVPLACALFAVLVAAVRRRDRPVTAAAFVAYTAALIQLLDAAVPVAPRAPANGPALRVVSINAFRDNPDPARLLAVITQASPDIVMVQEAEGIAGALLRERLQRYSRVSSCSAPPCSLAIFSRWPATRILDDHPPGVPLPDLLIARVHAPFGDFNLVSVHLPRMNRRDAEPFRAMLVDALAEHDGLPLLLGGDFNLPTGSFGLMRFEQETGLWRAERWIPTYPATLPVPAIAAIDHIYVSTAWRVQTCHRLAATASDHFGLACHVSLQPAGTPH